MVVDLLQLNATLRAVKTESTPYRCAFRLAPAIQSVRPLKSRTRSGILKPRSVRIVLTQPSRRLVVKLSVKSSTALVLALRSLPALEVIGSDSDLVAPAT